MDLSLAQLSTLKAAIAADPVLAAIPNNPDGNQKVADAFNVTEASFTVWKTGVTLNAIGVAMDGSEAANLTTANNSRLQVRAAFMVAGENPSVSGTRAFYDDIFSVGGVTKASLATLWRRLATRGEKLYANTAAGNGANATPATLVVEGQVTGANVLDARNRP